MCASPETSAEPPGAGHLVAGGQSQPQFVAEGWDALPVHGPEQHTAGLQHGAAQQQRPQLVVPHLLKQHQHHRVAAVLHQLVQRMVRLEPAHGEERTHPQTWQPKGQPNRGLN